MHKVDVLTDLPNQPKCLLPSDFNCMRHFVYNALSVLPWGFQVDAQETKQPQIMFRASDWTVKHTLAPAGNVQMFHFFLMTEVSAKSYYLCVQVKRGTSLIINKQSIKSMVIASFSDLLEAINRWNNVI